MFALRSMVSDLSILGLKNVFEHCWVEIHFFPKNYSLYSKKIKHLLSTATLMSSDWTNFKPTRTGLSVISDDALLLHYVRIYEHTRLKTQFSKISPCIPKNSTWNLTVEKISLPEIFYNFHLWPPYASILVAWLFRPGSNWFIFTSVFIIHRHKTIIHDEILFFSSETSKFFMSSVNYAQRWKTKKLNWEFDGDHCYILNIEFRGRNFRSCAM